MIELQLFLATFAAWANRRQAEVIAYLVEENRILKEQLESGGKRLLALESHGKGTRYTAMGIHRDEEGKKKHGAMGFHDGWGKALDQLVALVRTW